MPLSIKVRLNTPRSQHLDRIIRLRIFFYVTENTTLFIPVTVNYVYPVIANDFVLAFLNYIRRLFKKCKDSSPKGFATAFWAVGPCRKWGHENDCPVNEKSEIAPKSSIQIAEKQLWRYLPRVASHWQDGLISSVGFSFPNSLVESAQLKQINASINYLVRKRRF